MQRRRFASARFSCFSPLGLALARCAAPAFFRAHAGRPALTGGDRRVPGRRVGRTGAAQGNGLEGPLRAGRAQRSVHHRGVVQARPGRGLDQDPERRPRVRAVRPLPPAQLRPLLRPDRLLVPDGRGQGRGRRPVRHADAPFQGDPTRRSSRRFATAASSGRTTPTASAAAGSW